MRLETIGRSTFIPIIFTLATSLAFPLLASCDSASAATDVAWAVNIGGPAYTSLDSIHYVA